MNKKLKTTLSTLIMAVASISIAIFAFKATQPEAFHRISDGFAMEEKTPPPDPSLKKQKGHQVIAYYFHTTFRCTTCFTMEQLTQKAILTGFPNELKNGLLVWKVINVDEKENEHYVKYYKLYTKSVIVADIKDGAQVRWKNLKDIWNLVDDEKAFTRYIQDETQSYLGKS
ncbi:MAG TPA: nitrophenyl compound nitroreductase subunit ArsF family protein [Syntrophorhabdus sp.]|nr:nitrophenyl compound nitroreductase subunit ArsF family protein [Syntrophorhabdus sp.]